ncbi:hypothetical protein L195_g033763 [Trifolium pratense]|uniref:Uncharacterized protein n=1 Tax=Trifolium pratense TaxID=57577 RepID=A0A2K3LGX0_TRIPR|nr:hypothetical protein L195_g033763 [Trifolium pratense]
MGNPRGSISGTALEKVDENLPNGVSFHPNCCYSSAILKGLKQHRPPATFGKSTPGIFLSAVDNDDALAYQFWSKTWNGHYSHFSYCLMRKLDRVNKKGKKMLTNYHLMRLVDKKMMKTTKIMESKVEGMKLQHPEMMKTTKIWESKVKDLVLYEIMTWLEAKEK